MDKVINKYTSPMIDTTVDIEDYESVRSEAVDSQLAYLNALTEKMDVIAQPVFKYMTGEVDYPGKGLRIPSNIDNTSLNELMNILAKAQNAMMHFSEVRSILSSLNVKYSAMHDRRKVQTLINEGKNEQERKGLSSLRSDPELLLMTRIQMALQWAEPRYYAYGKMVDTLQQMATTKSVEMSREAKDNSQAERWQNH